MASGMMNGRNGHRNDYHDAGSVVGYIPDDVSSIHSSALGGVGVPAGYPPMFQSFTPDTWPSLQGGPSRRANGIKPKAAPESVAGESTAATESDITSSIVGDGRGQGGVSLGSLSIRDGNKHTSYNQSDRLKRYVENGGRPGDASSVFGGSSASMRGGRGGPTGMDDDDARSVSTAFASQVGGSYD
jgi:regulator of nonsense transcripts 1